MHKQLLAAILAIKAILLFPVAASAQSGDWIMPANTDLPLVVSRYEDICFTDTATGYIVKGDGTIHKTMDGAGSWRELVAGGPAFRSIEFLGDGVTGLAGSLSGQLYRTTDSGHTWTDISTALSDTCTSGQRNICGIAHFGNTFYGVGWWGGATAKVYKSVDKGVTWNTIYIDTALASCLVDVCFVSADTGFATGGKIPAGISFTSVGSVVLRTTDGGLTWTKVFSDTAIGGRIWKIQFVTRQLAFGSVEPHYYPDTINMIRSTDGGNSWSMVHVGRIHNSTVFFGAEQGVGFRTAMNGYLVGYFNGMFRTFDGGATWDTIPTGTNVNRIFVIDSNHLYGAGTTVWKWQPSPETSVSKPPQGDRRTIHKLHPVYPNPANGDITFSFDIGKETNVLLEVANTDGRKTTLLMTGRLKPGHYTQKWSPGSAPNGNYIVWLDTDEIPHGQRFVLQR